MKKAIFLISIILIFLTSQGQNQRDTPVHPTTVQTCKFYGLSKPLRELPRITEQEQRELEEKLGEDELNDWPNPQHPYAATALPKGPDPVWQKFDGVSRGFETDAMGVNFEGLSGFSNPPDPVGCIGPNHYMQSINAVYAIYDRTGNILAGPTNLNLLFGNVPGANCNNGDPIILYDEQASQWLVAEFSLCNANDRMLIAISQTSDPTGSWYQYSFDVSDVPDYMKFAVWRDAYYMGTNTHADNSNDVYAFERSKLLTGDPTAQMVGFDNPWRPGNSMGVMIAVPVDNDGPFAPVGEPGIFVIPNEDGAAGGTDQLWIMEMTVNWTLPVFSTFTRVQQLNVAAFSGDFGNSWDNIAQQGVAQKLCAVSDIIMNAPQYRNFSSYQTMVLCHTVDVDATNHAGVRWYELRKTTGNWAIRQQGTYAPDAHSRWMPSIHMNQYHEIAIGYSVSSSTLYPSIRVCGQNALENALGSGTMNVAEMTIFNGTASQLYSNRWGDYTANFVDPVDDRTFWYTNMYVDAGNLRHTRIASFNIYPSAIYVDKTVAASGNGSSSAPVKTVREAVDAAGNGTSLYIKGETYNETNPLLFHYSGRIFKWGGAVNTVIK